MSHPSTIDGAAARAERIELYVRLDAVDNLLEALLVENYDGDDGITRSDLGAFTIAQTRGPSRDDLLNELWPTDADVETAEYLFASGRAEALAGRTLGLLVPDQAAVVRALAQLAENAEKDVRMACEALAGRGEEA